MIAAVTGHRPKDLFGYDLMAPGWMKVRTAIKKAILDNKIDVLYTGMALGTDQLAALAVLDLKADGHAIDLIAAIPCEGQSRLWTEESRMLYDAILSKCSMIERVTFEAYSPRAMQVRNIHMVDRSDLIIAVYREKPGGTKNCVDYALKQNKPVWRIPPEHPELAGWMRP